MWLKMFHKYDYVDGNETGRKTTLGLIITLSVPKYLRKEKPTNLDER